MFEKIKLWYASGFWTERMVRQALEKGVLTTQQAEDILESGKEKRDE